MAGEDKVRSQAEPVLREAPLIEDVALMREALRAGNERGGERVQGLSQEEISSGARAISGSFPVGAWLITSSDLNLRSGPSPNHSVISMMRLGSQVMLLQTNPTNGFYNVKYGSTPGWASGAYLNPMRAVRVDSGPVVGQLQRYADAACSATGAWYVMTYPGHDPHQTRAVDILVSSRLGVMPSDFSLGDRVARLTLNQWGVFGIWFVVWRQCINYNDGRGWVLQPDQHDITKNHFDHVHASVYM